MKILLIFFLLTGCSTFFIKEKEKVEEKEFICTKIDCGGENIDQLIEEEKKQNIIACIKLQPECEA
jgi:hypothetical protein|tara:strand:+ start:44 stop:241 length:198 start_codon:yes stop_codon:yes gene_type:complete